MKRLGTKIRQRNLDYQSKPKVVPGEPDIKDDLTADVMNFSHQRSPIGLTAEGGMREVQEEAKGDP